MAFVDELKKKIAAEQDKLGELYSQIGKKYAELHRTDAEPELKALMDEVLGCEDAVKEYEVQIAQIDSKDRCPKCGAEVPEGFMFCGACGTKVRVPEQPKIETEVCPHCGTEVEKGKRFCTECGKPLHAPEPLRPQPEPLKPTGEAKLCPKCGAKNEPDSVFCESCGTKLDSDDGKKRCPKCGAELEPDSIFCTECGTKV